MHCTNRALAEICLLHSEDSQINGKEIGLRQAYADTQPCVRHIYFAQVGLECFFFHHFGVIIINFMVFIPKLAFTDRKFNLFESLLVL